MKGATEPQRVTSTLILIKIYSLLHTYDWHLGRALRGRKRYDEYDAFMNWLAALIESDDIDVLLVAGDVFDNSTPSNHAQELYYRFLYRLAAAPNRHVVVTAGNHDSRSFLNAPQELLKFLNIHVVGCASESPENEVIIIAGQDAEVRGNRLLRWRERAGSYRLISLSQASSRMWSSLAKQNLARFSPPSS